MTFQIDVDEWMQACFGEEISSDKTERNHRFLEESLELVQSLGCTASEAHQLVDYVFGRPVGDPEQEVGGVRVTLSALCNANEIVEDMAARQELARIWTVVEKVRAKQAAKPKHSPLPEHSPSPWRYPSKGDPMPEEWEPVLLYLDGSYTAMYFRSCVIPDEIEIVRWMPIPKANAEGEL